MMLLAKAGDLPYRERMSDFFCYCHRYILSLIKCNYSASCSHAECSSLYTTSLVQRIRGINGLIDEHSDGKRKWEYHHDVLSIKAMQPISSLSQSVYSPNPLY